MAAQRVIYEMPVIDRTPVSFHFRNLGEAHENLVDWLGGKTTGFPTNTNSYEKGGGTSEL